MQLAVARKRSQPGTPALANCASAAGSFGTLSQWGVVNTRTLSEIEETLDEDQTKYFLNNYMVNILNLFDPAVQGNSI
jgi:hypothetical protein